MPPIPKKNPAKARLPATWSLSRRRLVGLALASALWVGTCQTPPPARPVENVKPNPGKNDSARGPKTKVPEGKSPASGSDLRTQTRSKSSYPPTGSYAFITGGGQLAWEGRTFLRVDDYYEERAAARRGNYWGYIGPGGKWRIAPRYARAFRFYGGRALVQKPRREGGRILVLDKNGNILSRLPSGLILGEKHPRLSNLVIANQAGLRGHIGRDGRLLSPLRYDKVRRFSGGLAFVRDPRSKKWGVIAIGGRQVLDFQFADGLWFSGGMAPVRRPGRKKWEYIDARGQTRLDPFYDAARPFSEGKAVVMIQLSPDRRKIGFIGTHGRFEIQGRWSWLDAFHGSRALVRQAERGLVFVDPLGQYASPWLEDARVYSDGLAAAKKNGRWGYIDKSGRWKISPRFREAWPFSGKLARVRLLAEDIP